MEAEPEFSVLDIAILMIIVSDYTATNLCIDWAGMGEKTLESCFFETGPTP